MSTELGKIGDLAMTRFYGGAERGACVQFTPDNGDGYSALTMRQVQELRDKLTRILRDSRRAD